MEIKKGTTLEQFWKLLPDGAEEDLLGLDYDGRKGEQTAFLEGIGRVTTWLDACSEGEDRGGYVKWARLHDVLEEDGSAVVLEGEPGGDEFLFSDRMSVLL